MQINSQDCANKTPVDHMQGACNAPPLPQSIQTPYSFPDTSIAAPIEESLPTPKSDTIIKGAKKGAKIGFHIGLYASLWGIPYANCLRDAQYKGSSLKLRLKARKAKKRLPLYAVLCLPGLAIGGLAAATGSLVGSAISAIR